MTAPPLADEPDDDGIKRSLSDLEGSILGEVLAPILDPGGVHIAPTLGVGFVPPWKITDE